jgi:hypothetical protein
LTKLLIAFFFVNIQSDLGGNLIVFNDGFQMEQSFQNFLPVAEPQQHGDASQHGDTQNGDDEIQIHKITLLFLCTYLDHAIRSLLDKPSGLSAIVF